ncbi:MAG: DUF192 domain-containing protein [Gammaproteobacteria bacterium]|nr:DUF192 domain-containing protein [Gammaproteobacteria bacterium]
MRLGEARFLDSAGKEVARIKQVWRTESALERTRGLLGRDLAEDAGLWIAPCASVHSFGMGYPIDLVYLDRQLRVRKLVSPLRPWRASLCLSASSTLELPAGKALVLNLEPGMRMEWIDA